MNGTLGPVAVLGWLQISNWEVQADPSCSSTGPIAQDQACVGDGWAGLPGVAPLQA